MQSHRVGGVLLAVSGLLLNAPALGLLLAGDGQVAAGWKTALIMLVQGAMIAAGLLWAFRGRASLSLVAPAVLVGLGLYANFILPVTRLPAEHPSSSRARYTLSGDQLALLDGTLLTLGPRLRGRVAKVDPREEWTGFGGWAGDVKEGQPVDQVLVFVDGRFCKASPTDQPRTSLAARLKKPGLVKIGFWITLTRQELDRQPGHQVRFVALRGGNASELLYPKDYPYAASSSSAEPDPEQDEDLP